MSTLIYCVYVIPAEHKPAAGLLMSLVNGDPLTANGFGRGANLDGSYVDPYDGIYDLATHFFGGMPCSETWLDTMAHLATLVAADELVPPGGWPSYGVSKADAIAAGTALYLSPGITQNDIPPVPQVVLNAAMSALGLVPIVAVEE